MNNNNNNNNNLTRVIDFRTHWQQWLFSIHFFFIFHNSALYVAFLLKIYYLYKKKNLKE